MRASRKRPIARRRCGAILVPTILLLTALCGMVGLVIDAGLAMSARRLAQNAADAGAMAAALELKRGNTVANAQTASQTFVQTYNGLSTATVTTNIPPTSGVHTTDHYAEVIVSYPVSTFFMGLLGFTSDTVKARSVAGYEQLALGEGAIVLDPTAQPGLSVQGTGTGLIVNGSVVVNSEGPGLDQYGNTVNPWNLQNSSQPAVSASTNTTIKLQYLQVNGGVDSSTVSAVQNTTSGGPNPLFAGLGTIEPDPLASIAVPQASNTPSIPSSAWTTQDPSPTTTNGVTTFPSGYYTKSVPGNGTASTLVFNPGIYADIAITTGQTVTFNPGVYILAPQKNNQGLAINGGTVTGSGVMFYFTSSDYMSTSTKGAYDAADSTMAQTTPTSSNAPSNSNLPSVGGVTEGSNLNWATLSMTGGNVTFTPLADTNNTALNGLLFYQRRRNTSAATIGGNTGNQNFSLSGTIYARWALFKLSGSGAFNAQFITGSLSMSGGSSLTINGTGKNFGLANEVFLVE